MRIDEHPILGEQSERKTVTFYYDGKPIQGFEGEPVAAALYA
ncbi:MAG: (2Fe-2S)-binding protein, partial [Solobacterium sp.]|nr:(2Fe-2S)-binding protein [Solobacterium sp.]